MSEIPYYFETPVPKYFRDNGWFDKPNTLLFVTWAFSKCSTKPYTIVICGKEVKIEPFQFLAGRLTNPQDCFLTEKQFRGQLNLLIIAGLLKKAANSRANKYTIYTWVTERFCKTEGQQKGQLRANRGPTEGHNLDIKNKRYKKDHQPYPSSFSESPAVADLADDLSSKREGQDTTVFEIAVNGRKETISLDRPTLDACIAIKGSQEAVEAAITYVLCCPGRKAKIMDWPNVMRTWRIKSNAMTTIQKNRQIAERLERDHFPEYTNGWRCSVQKHFEKDMLGLLFEQAQGYTQPVFFDFAQFDFQEKVAIFLREKQIQRGRIPSS